MASVLIVDDSPTETYKIETVLQKNGFVVFKADNGWTASRQLKSICPTWC